MLLLIFPICFSQHLEPGLGNWTKEEDELIMRMKDIEGLDNKTIASSLAGRDHVTVGHRYNMLKLKSKRSLKKKKKKKKEQSDSAGHEAGSPSLKRTRRRKKGNQRKTAQGD